MRPLDRLGSIKNKLGVVIVAGVLVSDVAAVVAIREGVSIIPAATLAAVLALVFVQLLARGLTRPLREMASASRAMARGDYGVRVDEGGRDEVGELARAFNAMAAELAETDRQRRDLVANVSHELRTPITALRANLENIVDGVQPADGEEAVMRTMLAQTERLGRLVEQLLDLSRLESQATPFEARPFVVADVLEQTAREARLHAPDGVVFVVDAPPQLRAAGDPERIHQVVANLVQNAVRHTPVPGTVRLAAGAGGRGRVRIEVDDEGPGIPPEEADRVFERFYRADASRAADGSGAGLGLAIARWIVDLHGGDIRAERRQPTGCRMVLTLPRSYE